MYDSETGLYKRLRNRLAGYDYSLPGNYFVTVCTKNRVEYFGEVRGGRMIFNDFGKIIKKCWLDLPNHYKDIVLDEFVVMPNHIHGIVKIVYEPQKNVSNVVETGLKPVSTFGGDTCHGLSEIIRGFKTFSSRKINESGVGVFRWQRSFYDHIIKSQESYNKITKYIRFNPIQWELDRNNPSGLYF